MVGHLFFSWRLSIDSSPFHTKHTWGAKRLGVKLWSHNSLQSHFKWIPVCNHHKSKTELLLYSWRDYPERTRDFLHFTQLRWWTWTQDSNSGILTSPKVLPPHCSSHPLRPFALFNHGILGCAEVQQSKSTYCSKEAKINELKSSLMQVDSSKKKWNELGIFWESTLCRGQSPVLHIAPWTSNLLSWGGQSMREKGKQNN
jgi:hypothetical protein